ncbi:MAG: STAS/SEC14 domain-containing protein [Pacificimonas sp.]|jgi:hypothetical protein|nr:STAS/SEC14 domain-containing protein [Pacificimonas sp.]
MLTYDPVGERGYAELTISGHISADDFDAVTPLIKADIEKHGKIRLLETVESFSGMDPMAFVRDIQFSLPLVTKISHVALIAKPSWMRVTSDLFGGLFPGKVKSFEPDEEAVARLWLTTAS